MEMYMANSDAQLSKREGTTMTSVPVRRPAIARLVNDLKEYGGLSGTDIANIVGVSPPTVSRWSNGIGVPSIQKQAVIAELRWVAERLADFYTPEEARVWLHSAHPLLKGERAIDLINQGRTGEVLQVLEQLDSGTYL
jgi:transcriptional regulator with XRE-family HTH domain